MRDSLRFYNEGMRSLFAQLRPRKFGSLKQRLTVLMAAGLLTVAAAVASQAGQQGQFPDATQPPFGAPRDRDDPTARQREEKLEKGRNVERQQRLVTDTDKLLELARELKQEVDKSNKDTLSVDVVKKASEIEKLAKSVRERMRE
jgi:hypothetical protein